MQCCIFDYKKTFFSAPLFLGGAIWVMGAAATDAFAQAKPAVPDFTVISAAKDATYPTQGGSKVAFVVNGAQGRTLVLTRGKTYTFGVDIGQMHGFYFTTDPAGWGASPLAEGVTGNFMSKDTATIKPSATTPDIIYYQCYNHKNEGGKIHVVNPGDEGKIKIAEPVIVSKAAPAIDKDGLKKRLDFADMTINQSEAAKRIMASSNAEAKAKHKDAQGKLAEAQSAFNSNNLALSQSKADESSKLMTAAAQLVPSEFQIKQAKDKYDELVKSIKDLEISYAENHAMISRESGAKNLPPLDNAKIRKELDAARALFAEGKYDKANDMLTRTHDEAAAVLNKMLANRTMSYVLKFDTPEQEYNYEIKRYYHFEELIPLAIEQKQPPKNMLILMEGYVNKAKAKRDQAIADAKQKKFADALAKIKEASDDVEAGLKLIGVR